MVNKKDIAIQSFGMYQNNSESYDFYECLECNRSILNPICPQCIADEFISWLDNYPKSKKSQKMIKEINLFLQKHKQFINYSEKCIECNEKSTYLCPYCFTYYLFNILKKNHASKKMMKEFIIQFDYDTNKNGYYQELKNLGIV